MRIAYDPYSSSAMIVQQPNSLNDSAMLTIRHPATC
jgi:hypothetical protein